MQGLFDEDETFGPADLDAITYDNVQAETTTFGGKDPKWDPVTINDLPHPLERYAKAGDLDAPDPYEVSWNRGKGYPWPPYQERPFDYFQGASSIGSWQADFSRWQRSQHAKVAAQVADQNPGLDVDLLETLIARRLDEADGEAMRKGTLFHQWSAKLDAGITPGRYDLDLPTGWAKAWQAFKARYDVDVLAVERVVYAPSLRIAGTCDRIVRINRPPLGLGLKPGSIVVADLKTTGKESHRVSRSESYCDQVAALAQADYVCITESQETVPIPRLDGGVIVTVCPDGKAVVNWIDVHEPDRLSKIKAHAYARWVAQRTSNTTLGVREVISEKEEV